MPCPTHTVLPIIAAFTGPADQAPASVEAVRPWEQLESNITLVLQRFSDENPRAQSAGIESALDSYLDQSAAALPAPGPAPSPADCTGLTGWDRIQAIDSITLAPQGNDGSFFVPTDTPFSVTAGVSDDDEGTYDVSKMPCITHAALAAIALNGDAPSIRIIATDPSTARGARFSARLDPQHYPKPGPITLVAIFYDQTGTPRFVEAARASIQPAPASP